MTDKDKLIDLLYDVLDARPDTIADYLLANGVKVLPLPIGSTVYEIRARGKGSPRGRYCDYSVTTNYSLKNAIERGLDLYIEQKFFVKTDMTRWNKTVFLTKEEAENALVTDTNVGSKKEREGK